MSNDFNETVEALFKGMDNFVTTKTIVGEAIHIGDTIILPLADVSFALGAGAFAQEGGHNGQGSSAKKNGGGGMGGKVAPSAVLVIQNGVTKLVNVKNQDGVTKILDLVPDLLDRFTAKKNGMNKEENPEASFTIVEEDEMISEE